MIAVWEIWEMEVSPRPQEVLAEIDFVQPGPTLHQALAYSTRRSACGILRYGPSWTCASHSQGQHISGNLE